MPNRAETHVGNFHAWLWPDHAIGLRESRRLREEHNALLEACSVAIQQRDATTESCDRILRQWKGATDRARVERDALRASLRTVLDHYALAMSALGRQADEFEASAEVVTATALLNGGTK